MEACLRGRFRSYAGVRRCGVEDELAAKPLGSVHGAECSTYWPSEWRSLPRSSFAATDDQIYFYFADNKQRYILQALITRPTTDHNRDIKYIDSAVLPNLSQGF